MVSEGQIVCQPSDRAIEVEEEKIGRRSERKVGMGWLISEPRRAAENLAGVCEGLDSMDDLCRSRWDLCYRLLGRRCCLGFQRHMSLHRPERPVEMIGRKTG